ncbi:MBL fold metallo-hydrolase [Streptomyces kebangsaanensis]|uniref:MBL fold metallo-hydrolase n=1 Tax=Streptomyces kebangsaanensis TaxID=864058 RepID=UPI00094038AA|nr:MBL fold metallo-hydrolase [Streptomyces kebangsaanensis]
MRTACESPHAPVFHVQEVAEHVFAYVQPDGGWCLNNAGIIAPSGHTALIDTAATQVRARALKEAVSRISRTPPRYLVNTHPHGDHTFGNSQFTDTAVAIAHERTRAEMDVAGLHLTGLWPDVHWGEIAVELPALTFRDRMTLHVGDVRAELMHLGVAHTTNDTLIWLPEQRVLFTGDVVMSGVTPFCLTGSVSGSIEVIEELRTLGAETVVSGHGPVAGPEILDETYGYLRLVQQIAADGLSAGLSPLDAAREADLGPYGDLLDAERLVPNLHRAYAEARGEAPGSRLDVEQLFASMVEYHGRLPKCAA